MDQDAVDILLVEDSPEDAEMTKRALRSQGLTNRLHHVKDGVEALDFLFGRGAYAGRDATNLPRVVLLDLKLPKVDGLEVLREIKNDPRTRVVPVVVMTSSREDSDLAASYRLGVNSFIVKPVTFNDFMVAVSKLGVYWLQLNQPSA